MSSPRAWGCFLVRHTLLLNRYVFPTCVGVFLFLRKGPLPQRGLPHVRGGVSTLRFSKFLSTASSPRAWGCFLVRAVILHSCPVFPTCVGVFPHGGGEAGMSDGLPHVRGGVSTPPAHGRPWRQVFPTCVGVFLAEEVSNALHARLPHVRGGVSRFFLLGWVHAESSPRAWGCFPPEGTSHEPV